VIFVCAYGECSAMAVEIADELGWTGCRHLTGGLNGWWPSARSLDSSPDLSTSRTERTTS
jgi:rhodanese-related sulfurtransferase